MGGQGYRGILPPLREMLCMPRKKIPQTNQRESWPSTFCLPVEYSFCGFRAPSPLSSSLALLRCWHPVGIEQFIEHLLHGNLWETLKDRVIRTCPGLTDQG